MSETEFDPDWKYLADLGAKHNLELMEENKALQQRCTDYLYQAREDASQYEKRIAALEAALDEIAYGAPWGGPAEDHVKFMRSIADKALTSSKEAGKEVCPECGQEEPREGGCPASGVTCPIFDQPPIHSPTSAGEGREDG